MLGQNRRKKCQKSFYIHTNIITKKWGEKLAKQFMQKHTNRASKKCREKIIRKKCQETFFYIHTYIMPKKWGEKTREVIFPEPHK